MNIEIIRPFSYEYAENECTFGLVSENNKLVTNIATCRDYINDAMRACVHCCQHSSSGYRNLPDGKIDFSKLRLIVGIPYKSSSPDLFNSNLYRLGQAIKALNMYEELAGWEERSELHDVCSVYKNTVEETNCFKLVIGPGEWMRASHAVSMVTLIIRGFVRSLKRTFIPSFYKMSDLQNWIGSIVSVDDTSCFSDFSYFKNGYKMFPVIMKHYDEIFPADKKEVLFPVQHSSWHSCGGISCMCSLATEVQHIDEKMRLLKERYKNVDPEIFDTKEN